MMRIKEICQIVVILTLGLSFFGLPAWAGPCRIQVGPGWIRGQAQATPLAEVLAQVAEKTHYTIYLDETLNEKPVTFNIQADMAPEKAIRRMVHPHSYAVVYGSEPDQNGSHILEVKVFSEGRMHTARYTTFHGTNRSVAGTRNNGNGHINGGSALTNPGTGDTPYTGRSIKGKNLLKPNLTVQKNIFGAPVIKYRDSRKGPDYRPSAYEMRKSYERYQRAKHMAQLRRAQALMTQAERDSQQQGRTYQTDRDNMIKQYLDNYNK